MFIPVIGSATGGLTFIIGTVSGARDSPVPVSVPINVSNNSTGFAAVGFVVSYEADKLTLVSVSPAFQNELPIQNFTLSSERIGDRIFQWILFANVGDMTRGFEHNEVTIANINFSVNPNAAVGPSFIDLSWTPAPREGRPVDLDASFIVGAQAFGGNINITAGTTYTASVVGGTGGGNFVAGAAVSISANTPPEGQLFKNWNISPTVTFINGTSASSPNAIFAMPSSNVTATAIFEDLPEGHNLITITTQGNGTANANVQSATQGTTVTLSATPETGNSFVRWDIVSGSVTLSSTTTATATFTMPDEAVEIRAVFQQNGTTDTFSVSVTGGTGGGNYTTGTAVNITANAPPVGQQFSNWNISPVVTFLNNTSASTPDAVFTMPSANVTATAVFEDIPTGNHVITVTTQGNGTANANVQSAAPGATITLTATPNSGSNFVRWEIVNGTFTLSSTTTASATFTMPDTAVTVRAVFEPTGGGTLPPEPPPGFFRVTVVGGGTGSTPTADFQPGATVTINAGASTTGATFSNWTATPTITFANANNVTTTFVMPPNNLTVTANWTGGSGSGGSGGDASTISVLSHFGTWTGTGNATARVDGDHTKFVRLLRAGNVVPATNYTVTAGSTIITLNEAYLRNFANGTYTFRAEFEDGFSNLTLIVSHNFGIVPQTGIARITGTVITMWLSIFMTLALGVCLYTYVRLIRKNRKTGPDHEN